MGSILLNRYLSIEECVYGKCLQCNGTGKDIISQIPNSCYSCNGTGIRLIHLY
jgi:DnaJ-class molecular chaperone